MKLFNDFLQRVGVLAIVLLILWLLANIFECRGGKEKPVEVVSDTIIITDTIRDTIPHEVHDTIVRYLKKPIKEFIHDTIVDVVGVGGTMIEIPISQKEYSDDSTYRVWVSGYEPHLDSIETYNKTIVIDTKEFFKKKSPFYWGLQGGAGYGIFSKRLDIYVGVGVGVQF